jgi:hypothetical protein
MDLLYFYINRNFSQEEIEELFERISIHKLDFKLDMKKNNFSSKPMLNSEMFYNKDHFNKYIWSIIKND